jgi:transcriptional regulator with XRE-family HTH domain
LAGQTPSDRATLASSFGERLRVLRERRGLSREEFSNRFDVTGVANLELGRREPRLSDILALCDGMKVTPNALLRGFYQRTRKPRKREPARVPVHDQAHVRAPARSRAQARTPMRNQAQTRARAPAKRAS